MDITFTDEAQAVITVEQKERRRMVKRRLVDHKVGKGSFADVKILDGELIVVTAYGTLVLEPNLHTAHRHKGTPKGRVTGLHWTGKVNPLPASSTG